MPKARQERLIEWFRDLREPLRRFLGGQRGVAVADLDDVAQEVFLRLLRFDRAELVEQPKAYLFKMAANVASEWKMRARQRWPHDSEWLAELPAGVDLEDSLHSETRDAEVAAALNKLPRRTQAILKLHFSEGLTHEAIAERLQVTRRIVKREIIRAYADLRVILSNHEDHSSNEGMIERVSENSSQTPRVIPLRRPS